MPHEHKNVRAGSEGRGEMVKVHFTALVGTDDWLTSNERKRQKALDDWIGQLVASSGAVPVIADSAAGIVNFYGGDDQIARVREWASAHSRSVRVLR